LSRKRSDEKRKRGGMPVEDSLDELSRQLREKSPNGHRIEPFDEGLLMENLHLANAFHDKNMPGNPASDRKVAGPIFTFFKRIVWRMTSWSINPSVEGQALFNAYMVRSVNEMKRYLDHVQINEDILSTIMHRDLALFRANILYLNKHIEGRMLDFESALEAIRSGRPVTEVGAQEEPRPNGGHGNEILSSLDVLSLEQRIHGSPRVVQERQRAYVQYFTACINVLALGCGRGELLQLFAQEGVQARGTDMNATLVSYCRDNELDVSKAEPLEYLESCEDGSLDGIILSRFAGHQPPARLVRMLNLCRQKLMPGATLLIEAPNPFSLYTVASYALDDADGTHPLHPETLRLLCVTLGFQEPTVMFMNPLPPEEHLEELDLTMSGAVFDVRQQELFHQMSQNFAKLNRILFSHSDYAVVTRRKA
jgi:SAM-dependent methyltransferase